jgi:hypothetical protein
MAKRLAVLVVLLLLAFPIAALAGPNAGAAIFVSCGSVTKTTPATCSALHGGMWCYDLAYSVNTQLAPLLSWIAVYVGREPPWALTSVSGVDFGILYDPNALYLPAWTHCGSLEVNGIGWPQPNTGTTVVWTSPQAGYTVLVGYFTVTKYAGYPASSYDWALGAHPLYGTARVTDGSSFDELRYPAIANLMGIGGSNPCGPDPVLPTTWGQIKEQYRD